MEDITIAFLFPDSLVAPSQHKLCQLLFLNDDTKVQSLSTWYIEFIYSCFNKVLYEYAFSICGLENFRIVHSTPPHKVIRPNYTLREAGIVRNSVVIVEPAEDKIVHFMDYEETQVLVTCTTNFTLCQ